MGRVMREWEAEAISDRAHRAPMRKSKAKRELALDKGKGVPVKATYSKRKK